MSHNFTESRDTNHFHLCSLLKKQEPNAQNFSSLHIPFIWIICIVISVLVLVAVAGNALVLAVIWRTPALRTPSYTIMVGLAFIDLCTGLIIQPLSIVYMVSDLQGNKPGLCIAGVVTSILEPCFLCITMGTMTLMSLERWLHMTRRSVFTNRRVGGVFAILISLPMPFITLYMWPTKSVKYKEIAKSAGILYAVICFILTPLSYFKVFKIIRQHQQQVHSNQVCQVSHTPAFNLSKYKKSVDTILYLLAVFTLGFTPALIWLIIHNIITINDEGAVYLARESLNAIILSTSSVNPVLYFCRTKDILEGVKIILKKIFCMTAGNG